MNKEQILKEVLKECDRQIKKWGEQNHEPSHWLMILGEEVGEANKAALEAHFAKDYPQYGVDPKDRLKEYRKELIQVAAVAISMIASYDRNQKNNE